MNHQVKWGVIGSGGIARRRTIPEGIVAADNAILVSVFDVNTQINAEVAKESNAQAVNSIEELLATDIQAVYIATPAKFHYAQVVAAAQAKKHVLCEKPLGMSVTESDQMLSVCKQSKVKLGTAFMMRFQSQHQAALKMVQEGKLGKLVSGRAQLSCWYPPIEGAWRQNPEMSGGGSLMDMGGHCIDLLEMYLGEVKKVHCFTNNTIHPYKAEDSAVATLFFENGAMGIVDTFFCIPDNSSKNILELYGSKGSILAKGTIGQGEAGEMFAFLSHDEAGYHAQQTRDQNNKISMSPEPVNMYRREIEEFSQAIIENREPTNSAELGIRSQKIIAACYESARTGKTIDL